MVAKICNFLGREIIIINLIVNFEISNIKITKAQFFDFLFLSLNKFLHLFYLGILGISMVQQIFKF